MDLDAAVKEFAECVAAQDEAVARGDSRAGNRFAKRYVAAFGALRGRGDRGRDALTELFEDPRPCVRVMAAAFLLRHSGARARAILEREARGGGLVALGAAQALQRWDEGTWSLDPA